jgi:predicted dehydrogenase
VRFFRWRNYQDYGTGVAGDLFVHLFSGLHVTISSDGPNRIYATGGLRYWKDGRDVPDLVLGLFDYPETSKHSAFNLQMRVNFVDGGGGGSKLRLVGTEGVMEITGNSVIIRQRKMASAPGYGGWDTYNTFSEKQQTAYKRWYDEEYANAAQENLKPQEKIYTAPEGYNADVVHHTNFFNALRTGGKVVEDGTFGLRACAPSLAANKSVFEQRVIHWDPVAMQLK